jgi:hypothetical protein
MQRGSGKSKALQGVNIGTEQLERWLGAKAFYSRDQSANHRTIHREDLMGYSEVQIQAKNNFVRAMFK